MSKTARRWRWTTSGQICPKVATPRSSQFQLQTEAEVRGLQRRCRIVPKRRPRTARSLSPETEDNRRAPLAKWCPAQFAPTRFGRPSEKPAAHRDCPLQWGRCNRIGADGKEHDKKNRAPVREEGALMFSSDRCGVCERADRHDNVCQRALFHDL
jgi:hypothetical protein